MAIEHALLGLLEAAPAHGYELMQRYEDAALSHLFRLEISHLYALLKKLEAEGLVVHELQPQGTRPPRKVYAPTTAGREEFESWLQRPVSRIREIRVEFMIKLYFARQRRPADLQRLLERQIGACMLYQQQIDDELARTSEEFEATVLLVRRRHAEQTIEWLQEYLAHGELVRPGLLSGGSESWD